MANWHFYYRKSLEANISDVRAGKDIYVYIYIIDAHYTKVHG